MALLPVGQLVFESLIFRLQALKLRLLAGIHRRAPVHGIHQIGDPGQPFLQAVVEAVLGMAGLDIQEPQNQLTAQTQQRGTERGAHTL